MRRVFLITALTVTALAVPSARTRAQEAGGLETRVWLDQGDEPVLRRGETVRVYYRASEDAYAAIFRIDTDGRISMIFPMDPRSYGEVEGGRDYRLLFPTAPVWRVNEDPGVGYFFMIASPEPLDFSVFPFDPDRGWDLDAVGRVVYEDPYVAIDDYVAQLIPDWQAIPYALDFVTYNVGDTYTYPRFLCYDCHDARPYSSWNPYATSCSSVRVVIWDDPYFYPSYRYYGTQVVVARPFVTQPRYAVAVRAPGESYRPLIRSRAAPARAVPAYKEDPGTLAPSAVRRATARPTQEAPRPTQEAPRQEAPRPTLQRRPATPETPSSRLPVRTPPSTSREPVPSTPSRGGQDPRIVRPSPSTSPSPGATQRPSGRARPSAPSARPSTGAGSGTRAAPSRPSQPSARPSAPSTRSGGSAPSRPSAQPSSPSTRPNVRPSAPPSRPSNPPARSAQPSAPSRPQAQPSAPSRAPSSAPSRPSTGSRPTVRPRPND